MKRSLSGRGWLSALAVGLLGVGGAHAVEFQWTNGGMTAGWFDVDNWNVVCSLCVPDSTGPNETDEDATFLNNGTNTVTLADGALVIGAMEIRGDTNFGAPSGTSRSVEGASLKIIGTSGDTVVTMSNGTLLAGS